ncbi:MAG: prolyl oligopeptidase family serine peptidase [Synechococcaceae cyanobacterium]|nr:prolyl oligopeptidase family serine peptidase [Synechococcaceae cyanobacterium]
MSPQEQPPAALSAAAALAGAPQAREPRLAGGWLFWLEQRPAEGGRTTLLMRRAGDPASATCELTPAPRNLRSRLHGYGGGVYAVAAGQVVFVDDGDRCLWSLELPEGPSPASPAPPSLPPPARRLIAPADPGDPAGPRVLADGLIDAGRQRWIGVREQAGRDALVALPLSGGEPVLLHAAADFCGYPVLSPDGSALAWLEWQQPFMPWQRSQLWLAAVAGDGSLSGARPLAGSGAGDPQAISVFQPLWAGSDLIVANDRSGWWNLDRLPDAARLVAPGMGSTPAAGVVDPDWQPLLPLPAEFAAPQWVHGLRITAWDGSQLLAAACRDGRWQLGRLLEPERPAGAQGEAAGCRWQPFARPFEEFSDLQAGDGLLVAIAGSPHQAAGLLELNLANGGWQHSPSAPPPLPPQRISCPEALAFTGFGGLVSHAWYYPPSPPAEPAPLLVRCHSGPTGMARTVLNPVIQFWTSRGWGVVDVNYGGSSGFGRAYRERLDGQWGVLDVADCLAAVALLIASGRADPQRIAMEGGSAAGLTALEALAAGPVLRAAACRYPVTDMALLQSADHRFEARYFDTLVGPWPQARALYEARSPLRHPERIAAPVIFFHGLDDPVVPPGQSERMAAALQERGLPVELHLFPGEGHGFRSQAVQVQVLEATEAFLRRSFGL